MTFPILQVRLVKLPTAAYYKTHKKEITASSAAYYKTHKKEITASRAAYYKTHKKEITACNAVYRKAHKKEITAQKTARRKTDLNYRVSGNLRSRVSIAIHNSQKDGSAVQDLGCAIPEFID